MLKKFKRYGRFEPADLYAYKGAPKPKKQQVVPTTSQYNGTNSVNFSGPFGSASSSINPYTYTDPITGKTSTRQQIASSMSLSPELQTSASLAQTGLNNNLGYINQNPDQQVTNATSGNDPYYNVLKQQADQAYNSNLGRAELNAVKSGGANSTAAGSMYGNLAYQKDLLDQQNLLSALQYGNQQATQNVGTNMGTIGNIANLIYPLNSGANAQLQTAIGGQDAAQAQTAAAQNAANAAYNQAMNQYRQQQYENSFGSAMSVLSPVYGFASGHNQQAMQGIGLTAQLAGAALGMPSGGYTAATNFGSAPVNYAAAQPYMPNYFSNFNTNLGAVPMAM